jgi:hypothetical protein
MPATTYAKVNTISPRRPGRYERLGCCTKWRTRKQIIINFLDAIARLEHFFTTYVTCLCAWVFD